MPWHNAEQLDPRSFSCGYCRNLVSSNTGYINSANRDLQIYVCPHCEHPTHFDGYSQMPDIAPGSAVKALPESIEALYNEARNCVIVLAYTGSVLLSRKLLMNIAVAQGADIGKAFISYIEYLAANGYVPPNGKGWVDHIRRKGNEATHEIIAMSRNDAEELISFSEMLLKFIYEFPSRVPIARGK